MHSPSRDNGAAPPEMDRLLGAHDKSPQDALGDVTRTDLPRNVALAAAITFGLIGVLSAGPYVYRKVAPAAPVAEKPAEAAATAAAPAEAPAKAAAPTPPTAANDPLAGVAPPPARVGTPRDPILDKLDVGDTRTSDPKKNPLDKAADDLLKDLK